MCFEAPVAATLTDHLKLSRQEIRLTLRWGHILILAAALLTCEAVITGGGVLGCKPCAIDDCKNETNCLLGSTMDVCNCCTKCFRVHGK